MASRPRVAFNGRFATVPMTGVQRYAHELLAALADLDAVDGVVIVPPGRFIELGEFVARRDGQPDGTWSGVRGHAWEQGVLPALVRRARAEILVSPCNWGPLSMRRHLPLFHDVAPLFHPEYFTPSYARWARTATPRLVRRARRSAVTAARVRDELVEHVGADQSRIDIVPPGVGSPFAVLDVDPARPRAPRCVFVGPAADVRKNLGFLLHMWPRVHGELGLELAVVTRHWTSTRRLESGPDDEQDGVTVHTDLEDLELARLVADSACLLWPSRYEGYGLPLLESMAVGTPFLSTDTGAARELAVDSAQVLPLDHDAWFEQLHRWRADDPGALRRESMRKARTATWTSSAEALVDAIGRSCGS